MSEREELSGSSSLVTPLNSVGEPAEKLKGPPGRGTWQALGQTEGTSTPCLFTNERTELDV